ncbi:hypothetical protein KKB83_03295 [Patescibacteria group bacterium]|nr:hypothetical protein [Patescibacteria group bacterium]
MLYIAAIFFIFILILVYYLTGQSFPLSLTHKGKTLSVGEREQIRQGWIKIQALIEAPGASASNQAVIKADKLLDFALKKMRMKGETLGERLKNAQKRFSSYDIYDTAWKAHKIRNAVVHETGYDLTKVTARSVLKQYKAVLSDLGGI